MKELFIKILRFLMFVLVVALGCIGYNIYEDTLAAVWIPVGVGLVVAVVTLPLYKKWIWLTTMEQKAVNILCHVVCVGVIEQSQAPHRSKPLSKAPNWLRTFAPPVVPLRCRVTCTALKSSSSTIPACSP